MFGEKYYFKAVDTLFWLLKGVEVPNHAIGRKNWLFSNSPNGAEASAALYSLIGTAKDNGLHIEDYLEDVFTKLPYLAKENNPSYKSLLPWIWKTNSDLNKSI